jgi:hypothetical protein
MVVADVSIILYMLEYFLNHSVLLPDNAMYKATKVTSYSTNAQSEAVLLASHSVILPLRNERYN